MSFFLSMIYNYLIRKNFLNLTYKNFYLILINKNLLLCIKNSKKTFIYIKNNLLNNKTNKIISASLFATESMNFIV